MNFNLKRTRIYKAVAAEKLYSPKLFKTAGYIMISISFVSGMTFAVGTFLLEGLPENIFLGLSIIFFPFGLTPLFFWIYFEYHLKSPPKNRGQNTANYLTFEAAKLFTKAIKTSRKNKAQEVSVDALLFSILDYKPARHIWIRMGVDPEYIKQNLNQVTNTQKEGVLIRQEQPSHSLQSVLEDVFRMQGSSDNPIITIPYLIAGLFDAQEDFKKIIIKNNLDKTDLLNLAAWHKKIHLKQESEKRFWRLENLLRKTPIGADFMFGYPKLLSRFATDISMQFMYGSKEIEVVGQDETMDYIEQTLAKDSQRNALLVGPEGVGKKEIILGIAQKTARGQSLQELNYKRILEVDVSSIVSSSKDTGEVRNTLDALLAEAVKVGNVILLIENLHDFVGQEEGLGKADISTVLSSYLNTPGFALITTSNPISFHQYIGSKTGLLGSFEKIDIQEPDTRSVLKVLQNEVLRKESESGLFFTYGALKATVNDAERYIQMIPFPKKALDLLEEVTGYAKTKGVNIVTPEIIHELVTQKTHVPAGEAKEGERDKLVHLEEQMRKEIVGQEAAVTAIVHTMQRLRAGISRRGKPAGVFLFTGPTGVGKTHSAKLLAKHYFGSEENMVRFDMPEYQSPESIKKLLGSADTNNAGKLISAEMDNPFSVILLDELEKAHRDVLNIFLRIFDEGRIQDAFGRNVSFENNIIIATSNAGANETRQMIQQGIDPATQKDKLMEILISKEGFRPEFLNRFDEIVIFHPLSQENIQKIAQIMLSDFVERLKKEGYYFRPTQDVVQYISQVGFSPEFGARPMARAIQDTVESAIAKKILEGSVRKGEEFTISVQEITSQQ